MAAGNYSNEKVPKSGRGVKGKFDIVRVVIGIVRALRRVLGWRKSGEGRGEG